MNIEQLYRDRDAVLRRIISHSSLAELRKVYQRFVDAGLKSGSAVLKNKIAHYEHELSIPVRDMHAEFERKFNGN